MKLALCNEVLAPMPFAAQCQMASDMGYLGLEVAPFTLTDTPESLTTAQSQQHARVAADHGLAITGLHWLLVKPEGLSITHPDAKIRQTTTDFLKHLCEICAAMGGRYLVHGSPKQRSIHPGQNHDQAMALAQDVLANVAQAAQAFGVTYCLEPLSADQTPLINTVAQAAAVVQQIQNPFFKSMLDTSSAGLTETLSMPELIDLWLPQGVMAHVQLNDPNRRAPGQGQMRFAPILAALQRHAYTGVVAVEPFDYFPDGPGCAAWSAGYLKGLLEHSAAQTP
jgi:D-psicose/D-tagatose/L-ribulose 3-epimerase